MAFYLFFLCVHFIWDEREREREGGGGSALRERGRERESACSINLPKCALILCALHYQKLVTVCVISLLRNQTFTEMTDGIQSQMTE